LRTRKVLEKVTAFVTRDIARERQILVFRHPQAGIQVPAGTVELTEEPEIAVIREVKEETNISHVRLVNKLGSIFQKLPENEMVLLRLTKLFNEPRFDASSDGFVLDRGLIARVIDTEGGFSFVESEPRNIRENPTMQRMKMKGFVRSSLLTTDVKRYFYHLTTEEKTPDTWQVQADSHIFELFWSNLDQKGILNSYQQPWLERYRGQLVD
jgi:8-oxo-dGTP pyrophosphatase MutT (NUDIX family)